MSSMPSSLDVRHWPRDPLTGALSRAYLDDALQATLDAARRERRRVTLCLLDVDHFKSINDAYGHRRGDEALREVARRIQREIRSSDLMIRYGGDEFVLILPDLTRSQSVALAERLLARVQATPCPGVPPLRLSISVGVATFPDDADTAEALIERADQRHAQAKRQGRRCVVGEDVAVVDPGRLPEPARLIERDTELAAIHAFLARLPAARRGALLITGAPGTGRSRLLVAAVEAALQQGYAILPLESREPVSLAPGPGRLTVSWQELASLPGDGAEARLRHLAAAAGCHGLLIVFDGWEDLNPAARSWVERVLAGAGSMSIGVMVTAGENPSVPVAPFVARVVVNALSQEATRVWVRGTLLWDPPADFVVWLHRTTQGRPAEIRATLDRLVEQGMLRRESRNGWRLADGYAGVIRDGGTAPLVQQHPHNLPAALTEFVGRTAEVAQARSLILEHRLVTLTGPGGIGKTRLALEVAAAVRAHFPDGVWFVPLAPIHDTRLVPDAILAALGEQQTPGETALDYLKEKLQEARMLLVLDNLEQLADAPALVADLLAASRHLRVLVTSRHRLTLPEEVVFSVPPLPVPRSREGWSAATLTDFAATALFVARAQAVRPDFRVTDANAADIAALCARLDGLPLAIELAAARVDEFSPRDLLAQMHRRLAFLDDGPRDLPARQRTLRGAIDWGYRLLSPTEQRLFRRLAVFVGGATLEAISVIVAGAPSYGGSEQSPLAAVVRSLRDKSLLLTVGEGRVGMLETIREYALEQLAASGEEATVRDRHAAYMLDLVERSQPYLRGSDQMCWRRRLEAERDNIRAAMAWLIGQRDMERAGRLAAALWIYWDSVGRTAELHRWLTAVIQERERLSDPVLAAVLHTLGSINWMLGNSDDAESCFTAALQLWRRLGNREREAAALNNLGLVAGRRGEYDRAEDYFHASLAMTRETGDAWAVAITLSNLGWVALERGEVGEAIDRLTEALAAQEAAGDRSGLALTMANLGVATLQRGDYAAAAQHFEQSWALAHESRDERTAVLTLARRALLALIQGDLEASRRDCFEAIARWQELGYKADMVEGLQVLAGVAAAQRRPDVAARLLGAVAAVRAATRSLGAASLHPEFRRLIESARASLSPAAWQAAWQAGQTVALPQLIDDVQRELGQE